MTDEHASDPLRFEILGEVRVLRDGRVVDLGPAKQRAVLAVLLLQAGRPVPTHQIVDAVWGDEPPENGANVVQKYVAGLRRALDPGRPPRTPGEVLALTGSGYVLHTGGGSLDDADFRAATARAAAEQAAGRLAEAAATLRSGLALWRGTALAGLTGPVFDAARLRLAEAHATAWETWAEIELTRGQGAALVGDLTRLVEEFPLREGIRTCMMIALHQAGRQAEALAVFRDAREFLVDQFGAEPGERMQDVHRRILRGETFYTAPADPWAGHDPTTPAAALSVPPPADIPAPRAAPISAPPPMVEAAQWHAPPPWMAMATPPRRQSSAGDLVLAIVLPLISCSLLSWVYFVVAGVRRRRPALFFFAVGYALLTALGIVLTLVDPSAPSDPLASNAEVGGFFTFLITGVGAAVHGAVLANQSAGSEREWMLREQVRQFAALEPARAAQLGVGRPDLARPFDDGLVDINHVPVSTLAAMTRLPITEAHRIVADRMHRGPFHRPEDLLYRGLVTPKTMHRLAPVLIAVQPAGTRPRSG